MSATLKGGAYLSIGLGAGLGLSFIRNLVVANCLSPANFGTASSLAIVVTLVEALSEFGFDRMLVQADDGDSDELLASAHFLMVLRGGLLFGLIFLSADYIADYFSSQDALLAYRFLGVVPLFRAFAHLERKRDHRQLKFRNDTLSEVGSQAIGAVVGIAVALITRSWWAMFAAIVTQSMVLVLISHLLAKSTFSCRMSRDHVQRLIAFGWPLTINGILIFAVSRGDSLIIASYAGLGEFGIYSVASILAIAPSTVLKRIVSSLAMPRLAAVKGGDVPFMKELKTCVGATTVAACGFAIFYGFGGMAIIDVLYRAEYAVAGQVVMWLGLTGAVQVLRSSFVAVAVSQGLTRIPLQANIGRAFSIVLLVLAAENGWGIVELARLSICGELIAVILIAQLLERSLQGVRRVVLGAAVSVIFVGVLAIYTEQAVETVLSPIYRLMLSIGIAGGWIGAAIWVGKDSRIALKRAFARVFSNGEFR